MRLTSESLVQARGEVRTARKFEARAHSESATGQFPSFVDVRAGRHADTRAHSIGEGGGS